MGQLLSNIVDDENHTKHTRNVVRNYQIVIVSIVAMTLFVLLIYPAIVPVNAPPVFKTFRDLFSAFAVFALLALFSLSALVNAVFADFEQDNAISESACTLLCNRRC